MGFVSCPRTPRPCGHLLIWTAVVQASDNLLFTVPGNRPYAMEKYLAVPVGSGYILRNTKDLIKISCPGRDVAQ